MNQIPAPPQAKPLYQALGVRETATAEEVRDAFMRIARARHPDVNGGIEYADFLAAVHAYEVLKDPEARASYDATGIDPGQTTQGRRAAAMGIITKKAFECIAEGDENGDFLLNIRGRLKLEAKQIAETLRQGDIVTAKARRAAEHIAERWKGAEAARDAILAMVEQQLAKDAANKAAMTQSAELIQLALKMLASATYAMPALTYSATGTNTELAFLRSFLRR